MASLTAFLTGTAATTVTTADTLVTTAPSAETSHTTSVKKLTGWGELFSQGTTLAWAAGVSEPTTPSGQGFLLDATTLEGQTIAAGTWTPTLKLSASAALTATVVVRAWVRSSAGVYTQIGTDMSKAGVVIGTTAATVAITGVSQPAVTLNVGDKLYVDVLLNITTAGTSTTGTVSLFQNGGANEQLVTPGYSAPLALAAAGASTTSGGAALNVKSALAAAGASTASGGAALNVKSVLAASGAATSSGSAVVSRPGDIYPVVPLYVYPTLAGWSNVVDAQATNTGRWLIANPNTGPGTTTDANYTTKLTAARNKGWRVFGYVNTNLNAITPRTEAAIKADVDTWSTLYPGLVDGIFFDLCCTGYLPTGGNVPSNLTIQDNISTYVHNTGRLTCNNLGTYPTNDANGQRAIASADMNCLWESGLASYNSAPAPPSFVNNEAPSRVLFLVYADSSTGTTSAQVTGTLTSLPVNATPFFIKAGQPVWVHDATNSMQWTCAADTAAGATSIPVNSATSNFTYAAGSSVVWDNWLTTGQVDSIFATARQRGAGLVFVSETGNGWNSIPWGTFPDQTWILHQWGQAAGFASLGAIGASTSSGSAALNAGPAGGNQPLAASGASTASGAAALNVKSVLAATGASTASGTAALNAGPAGTNQPLAASGASTASGNAALNVASVLAATGASTASGAAALNVTSVLAAPGASTTSGAAALNVKSALAASGASTTSGGADLTIPGQGSTALTAYLRDVNTTATLSTTARQIDSTAPSVESNLQVMGDWSVAAGTGYVEMPTRGSTTTPVPVASIPAPTGNGWVWDVATLEGKDLSAGTFTPNIKVRVNLGAGDVMTGSVALRVYKRSSAGVYTQIGTTVESTAGNFTGVAQAITLPTMSTAAAVSFVTGDKLYVDVWYHQTVDHSATDIGPNTVFLYENGGTAESVATPGYVTTGGGSVTHPLAAAGASTSSGSAALNVTSVLAAAGSSTTTGSGALGVTATLQAVGASTTSGAAALAVQIVLAASGASTTTGNAAATQVNALQTAGASTTSGAAALAVRIALAASGASTTTGAAVLAVQAVLAAAGASTTTGAAALAVRIALVAAGASTTTGAAALAVQIVLAASGASTTSGSVNVQTGGITAAGASTTTGAAALAVQAVLAASGASTTTGAAALAVQVVLAAAGASTTTGAAALAVQIVLAASGASTTSGSVNVQAGGITAAGASTTTGAAALAVQAVLAAAGASTTSGTAALAVQIVLAAAGASTTTGAAALAVQVVLAAAGASTTTGAVNVQAGGLNASGTSTTSGAAALAVQVALAASGTSTTSGTASTAGTQVVLASGASTTSGAATLAVQAVLAASGTSTTSGAVNVLVPLGLTAAGSSAANGNATATALLMLAAAGVSTASGFASFTATLVLAAVGIAYSNGSVLLGLRTFIAAAGSATSSGGAVLVLPGPGSQPVFLRVGTLETGMLIGSLNTSTLVGMLASTMAVQVNDTTVKVGATEIGLAVKRA